MSKRDYTAFNCIKKRSKMAARQCSACAGNAPYDWYAVHTKYAQHTLQMAAQKSGPQKGVFL